MTSNGPRVIRWRRADSSRGLSPLCCSGLTESCVGVNAPTIARGIGSHDERSAPRAGQLDIDAPTCYLGTMPPPSSLAMLALTEYAMPQRLGHGWLDQACGPTGTIGTTRAAARDRLPAKLTDRLRRRPSVCTPSLSTPHSPGNNMPAILSGTFTLPPPT